VPRRPSDRPGGDVTVTVVSRILGRLAHLPPAEHTEVEVEHDLPMTTADGAVLLADRLCPVGVEATTLPVVLLRSPYGRRQLGPIGRLIAERGYQVVIQSCRGSFGSQGTWEPFRNEAADGREALAWVSSQPWWSGRLGTFGPSYLGLTQWAVASDPPPFLQAMALHITASRFRDIVVYPGGSFTLETGATWLHLLQHQELGWRDLIRAQIAARRSLGPAYTTLPLAKAEQSVLGREVGFYQDWLDHERPGDPWWDAVDFSRDRSHVPPATLVGGWYDIFLPAQVDDYTALVAAGRDARLTIGPYTHASAKGTAMALRDGLEWFDARLRDRPGRLRRHPVRLWVMGSERWVDLPGWPPPSIVQAWYLQAGGGLGRTPPDISPPDRYRYDPADPTPGTGGPSLNAASAGGRDQKAREQRRDVLTYTSAPMAVPMTIAGGVDAEVWLRSSLPTTDLFVRLCVVSRKGLSTNLCDGIMRIAPIGGNPYATARADAGEDEVVATGGPEWGTAERTADGTIHVRIRMWPTAVTFGRGERVRLQVSAGAHPLFVRNLGSGERLGTGTRLVPVDHEILHDPAHPSAVRLPLSSI
jgi:putative CocE/NonD family hydrolase